VDALTPRQREVAELCALGLPTKRIARELGISVETVASLLTTIAAKLPDDGPYAKLPRKRRIMLFMLRQEPP
jgi:DNA-binding CsgD family transcriptional regulator